jgi:hypothetical protein
MQIQVLRVLENTCLFVDRWKTVRAPDKVVAVLGIFFLQHAHEMHFGEKD